MRARPPLGRITGQPRKGTKGTANTCAAPRAELRDSPYEKAIRQLGHGGNDLGKPSLKRKIGSPAPGFAALPFVSGDSCHPGTRIVDHGVTDVLEWPAALL